MALCPGCAGPEGHNTGRSDTGRLDTGKSDPGRCCRELAGAHWEGWAPEGEGRRREGHRVRHPGVVFPTVTGKYSHEIVLISCPRSPGRTYIQTLLCLDVSHRSRLAVSAVPDSTRFTSRATPSSPHHQPFPRQSKRLRRLDTTLFLLQWAIGECIELHLVRPVPTVSSDY